MGQRFDGHTDSVEGVAFLPDGRFASATINGELWLWNASDSARRPAPVNRFAMPEGVRSFGFYNIFAGADGRHIASAVTVKDDPLWVWNVETQSLEQRYTG